MNTVTTHPAPEEIMALFDGELSAEQTQFVSTHIDQCAKCASVAAMFQSVSKMLADWQISSIPQSIATRVFEQVAKIRSGAHVSQPNIFIRASLWGWKQWAMRLGAAAACLLLLVFLRAGMYQMSVKEAQKLSVDNASVNRPESPSGYMFTPPPSAPTSRRPLNGRGLDAVVPSASASPMIARSASLTLVVKDFAASRAALDAILARHHAYAADLKASTVENAPRTLVAFLRVPAQDLGPTLVELKSLGRLQEETQNAEELTQQHADLVARLKNSRETEQRLRTILAQRAGKMSDVLEVEQEIARVRGEIESMEAQQKTLEHRVEFASVNLTLTEEYKASLSIPPLSAGSRLHNALVTGYRDASETILGIMLFFAAYGPTLIIWLAVLAIPVWLVRRRYRRSLASI
jgi:anti-sigma factor RsiW